jgi:hypothetical protein
LRKSRNEKLKGRRRRTIKAIKNVAICQRENNKNNNNKNSLNPLFAAKCPAALNNCHYMPF